MAVSVVVNITRSDGSTLNLTDIVTALRIKEGRSATQVHESPSKATVSLKSPNPIVELEGLACVILCSFGGAFTELWRGTVASSKYTPPDTQGETEATVEAWGIYTTLLNSQQTFDLEIRVTRDSNSEIAIADVVTTPTGIALTDELTLVVDASTSKVYAWDKAGVRKATADFDLVAANSAPVGLATDGADGILVCDANGEAYAYSTARRHVRNAEDDITLTETAESIGYLPESVVRGVNEQVMYLREQAVYLQNGSKLFDLSGENTGAKGINTSLSSVLLYDAAYKLFYVYTNIRANYWRRDASLDWSLANSDTAFEAYGRIYVQAPGRLLAYDLGTKARNVSYDLITASNFGVWDFSLLTGAAGTAEAMYVQIRRLDLTSQSSLPIYRTYRAPNSGSVWQTAQAIPGTRVRSRNSPGLLAATDTKQLYPTGSTAPPIQTYERETTPVRRAVLGANINAASLLPAGVTVLLSYANSHYAMNDDFVFVASLVEDENDDSGYTNEVLVYSTASGLQGETITLRISGEKGAIIGMYYSRNRLFVRFTDIPENKVLGAGKDPWMAYEPLFSTLYPIDYSGSTIPLRRAAGAVLDTYFDGLYFYTLTATRVSVYTQQGQLLRDRSFTVSAQVSAPVAIVADRDCVYVASTAKVFAYSKNTGVHKPELDVTLDAALTGGLAIDYERSVIYAAVGETVHVYRKPAQPQAAIPVPLHDIALDASVGTASGCVLVDDVFYVCHSDNDLIAAYDRAGVRLTNKEITATAGSAHSGLTSDGETLFVASGDNTIYGYEIATRTRNPLRTATLHDLTGLQAVSVSGTKLYAAADIAGAERLYVYDVAYLNKVDRPRETTKQRYAALVSEVLGSAPMQVSEEARLLPATTVNDPIRDSLRRVIDSEGGRAVDGVLYPRGAWRTQAEDMQLANCTLAITDYGEGAAMVAPPKSEIVDSLIANELVVYDFQGVEHAHLNAASALMFGRVRKEIPTYAELADAVALAEWYAARRGSAFGTLKVTVALLFESNQVAAQALQAAPHTALFVAYEQTETGDVQRRPWIVMNREIQMRATYSVTETTVTYELCPPRQYGIGWVLDGEIPEDRLGMDTILIDAVY